MKARAIWLLMKVIPIGYKGKNDKEKEIFSYFLFAPLTRPSNKIYLPKILFSFYTL